MVELTCLVAVWVSELGQVALAINGLRISEAPGADTTRLAATRRVGVTSCSQRPPTRLVESFSCGIWAATRSASCSSRVRDRSTVASGSPARIRFATYAARSACPSCSPARSRASATSASTSSSATSASATPLHRRIREQMHTRGCGSPPGSWQALPAGRVHTAANVLNGSE